MVEVQLRDVIRIKHGFAFKGEHFSDEETGLAVLTPGNFMLSGGFQEIEKYYDTNDFPQEFILSAGDLVVTMTDLSKMADTIGYSALVPENTHHRYLHNQRIGLVTVFNTDFDRNYIYWLMRSPHYQKTIANSSNGSTVHHTSPERIYQYRFEKIPKDTQKRIASILSAYDNLVEVNNKRIKVLEQMAENLYKEWFVRFRFPGYKNVEFETDTPRGWTLSTETEKKRPKSWHYGSFSELGSFVRGKNITAADMVEGNIPVISAGIEPSGYHNESNVHGNSLTISASGANAGFLKYNQDDIWAADCSYYQSSDKLWFAYNTLKFLQPVISNLQCGAAQPHVYPRQINKLSIIIPPENIISKFCSLVRPIYENIKSLIDENNNLIKQRDLLLPRLMSGKLEV